MSLLKRKFKQKWVRIGDLGINCPICGKPDWCRVSENGTWALCSRVPFYSQQGTMHRINQNKEIKNTVRNKNTVPINWKNLNDSFVKNCGTWRIKQFAALKGLSVKNLLRMQTGFDGECYTFPVYNDQFQISGIQRQYGDGKKLMVKGSTLGLFIPTCFKPHTKPLVVAEGASDCTAALDLGLNAIGRLNNSSGTDFLVNICRIDTYIISDNDKNKAGQNGAFALANKLKNNGVKCKVIIPPYKDLREWMKKTDLDSERIKDIFRKVPVL